MTPPLGVAALVLAVLVSAAPAEPVQITIAPPAEATTMDPGRSTQVLTVNYFVNLYDTLTRWDAALRLQPGLATSWRNVNDTTCELTLRPGLKFHDGSPLTAEDVKATLERNLLPGKTVVQAGVPTIESLQAITPNAPPARRKALAEGQSTKIVSPAATRPVTFWINATQPPLSDTRVRQALHLALDVDGLVKNLYAGMGRPMSGGLADTDFGYNPALKPYPYDPATAKRLLAQARRAGGIDVTLYAGSGTTVNDKVLLEAIADRWAKVGIRARVEMMEMAARQRMNNERTLPPNSLMLINPQSTLLDADGSLWRLFHPNGFSGKYWAGSQPGHRFHELMEEARYSLDPKKRKALYEEATQIIHEEKPWLELFQEVVVYGVAKRLQFKARPDYRLIVSEMTVGR